MLWKKIKSIPFKDVNSCLREVKKRSFVSPWIDDIFSSQKKNRLDKYENFEIHRISLSKLGFKKATKLKDVYKKFKKFNYDLIPPEISIYLRLIYKNQPKGEWLRISVPFNSMIDSDKVPHLPKLGRALGKNFLETYWSYPQAIFHPHNDFLVIRFNEKKIKLKNNRYLSNGIIVSPMCQYSSIDGLPTEWHYKHLSSLISSGASMLILESTAVSRVGHITHKDLGLYNNKQLLKFKHLINFLKKIKDIPICLQISHSGRKGSCNVPWIKSGKPLKKKSWKTISSSNKQKNLDWPAPKNASSKEIKKIISQFVNSAKKAFIAGFDGVEIHMAHGYLIHQFLSPICNNRVDDYGGTLKKRCKLAIEITKKIKKIIPKDKFLGARITGSDHLEKGIKIKDSIYLAKELKLLNINYLCVSSGGIISKTNLNNNKNAFRMKLAIQIKKNVKGILIGTTGRLENIDYLKSFFRLKKLDLAFIGRPFLMNPHWLYKNFEQNIIPNQYRKAFIKN